MAGLEKIIKVLKQAPKVVDEVPSLLTILGRAGVPAEAARITKPLGKDAALEAVRKIAERSKKVDDWGWKGGKPGEITGQEFESALRSHRDAFGNVIPSKKNADRKLVERAFLQTEDMTRGDVRSLMGDFADLEKADVPREWTGKIMRAIGRPLWEVADDMGNQLLGSTTPSGRPLIVMSRNIAEGVSNSMRPMTNDQRETFLALLPDWSGSLDELAEAAKNL